MKAIRGQEANLESSKGFYIGSRPSPTDVNLHAPKPMKIYKNNENQWNQWKAMIINLWEYVKYDESPQMARSQHRIEQRFLYGPKTAPNSTKEKNNINNKQTKHMCQTNQSESVHVFQKGTNVVLVVLSFGFFCDSLLGVPFAQFLAGFLENTEPNTQTMTKTSAPTLSKNSACPWARLPLDASANKHNNTHNIQNPCHLKVFAYFWLPPFEIRTFSNNIQKSLNIWNNIE